MSNHVDFVEFVSTNEEARKELEALKPALEGKTEQERADAFVKLAAKYGFTLKAEDFAEKMQELSEDELQAVAGGKKGCGESFTAAAKRYLKCGWCSYSFLW